MNMRCSDRKGPAAIEALILAGGLGSRLRSVIGETQKVIASVDGRPFVFRILDQLSRAGVKRAVLCVGYKAESVMDALGSSMLGVDLSYSVESSPMGTAGAVRLALRSTAASRLLVMNGDSYIDADLGSFMASAEGLPASILLSGVEDCSRYGKALLEDGSNRIRSFVEKGSVPGPGLINAGVYSFERELLVSRIPESCPASMEKDVFPSLLAEGLLYGFVSGSKFLDIGTPESYGQGESFFRGGCDGGS